MTETEALKAKLAECKRLSDNHRRARDYHKESVAMLRKDNEDLKGSVDFWIDQHQRMDNAYCESRRHQEAWRNLAYVLFIFASAMSVLFFWAVRK